jgi:hypothetical protein
MTEHFIGYRMLAPLDSRGTGEQEGQRENALKQEFMALVPAAIHLKASTLVLQRYHSAVGCRLEFFLLQRPQYDFDFAGTGEPPPAGANEAVAFENDVRRVQSECKDVKTRLVLAQSPTLGHQELASASPAALDKIALRQLFRRKAHTVVLPTPEGGINLDLPAAPQYLATGLRCGLSATVTKLTPEYMVHLRDLSLAASAGEPASPKVFLPTSALACRKQLSQADQANLLVAMDRANVVNLKVELAFEWATGAVSRIEVLSIAGTT